VIAEGEWTARMAARKGTPHGHHDPILPFSLAERLRDELEGAGLGVTFDAFAGPHTLPPHTLARLGAWLPTVDRRA
jgi:phospholipase/carboxylesterase